MKQKSKKILLEMTLIVLVAIAMGVVWNHRLLWDIYSGSKAGATVLQDSSAAPDKAILPAGLIQVKDLFDNREAVFVDAREYAVFTRGHIKQAVSLPLATLESDLLSFMKKVPRSATLVIYCSGYGCHDSKNLAEKLLARGYGTILIFEGGYPEWKDAGFPIEGADS